LELSLEIPSKLLLLIKEELQILILAQENSKDQNRNKRKKEDAVDEN